MKKYTFVLNCGYVEQASLSYFPFTSTGQYKNAKEALLDLAKFLKEQYEERHAADIKKCCVASRKKDPQSQFCSKCGSKTKETEFDAEEFEYWVVQMSTTDNDSFCGDFIHYSDEHRWQSNGLENAPNQRFVFQAEWVLSAALGYPHGEPTFQDICRTRRTNKTNSFEYW